jgi:hypothetical protein
MMSRYWPAGALLLASLSAQAQEPARNYVAVVVGLSTYQNLPKEVHLDFARSDAATVAQALEAQAHFTHVFLIRDTEATRENIRDTLRTKAAQVVGPNDVFVLYFVGHGAGADLGTPVLLAYDSTLENGQEDGLELQAFTRDLQTWTRAGTTLIVTDAIHRNQLDGIYFYGPAAAEWPALPKGTMLISSSQAASPAKDGAFGQVFAQGIGGAADADRNGQVTGSELFTFLMNRMSPTGQVPAAAGDFDGNMVVAGGVAPQGGASVVYVIEEAKAPPPPPEPVYPDVEISAAKFVFLEGASQAVQCREEPIVACSPSCYVRTFKAGPCTVSGVVDGQQVSGQVVVLQPGKYDCEKKGTELKCVGP